tara:strand:+ start:1567 stop:1773 length:207 start_codon:yes stop_codon:yes gene_type:complete
MKNQTLLEETPSEQKLDKAKLEEFKEAGKKLSALLKEPEPGLFIWMNLFKKSLAKINNLRAELLQPLS